MTIFNEYTIVCETIEYVEYSGFGGECVETTQHQRITWRTAHVVVAIAAVSSIWF